MAKTAKKPRSAKTASLKKSTGPANKDAHPAAAKTAKPKKAKARAKSAAQTTKAAKRPASKRKIEVIIKSKLLGKAPQERHFMLSDGRVLGSVMDLADAFREMQQEVFDHHVSQDWNHFADWIHDVFEEHDFAEEIRKLNSKVDTEIACLKRLIHELKTHKGIR